jgi:hypothetical protein
VLAGNPKPDIVNLLERGIRRRPQSQHSDIEPAGRLGGVCL